MRALVVLRVVVISLSISLFVFLCNDFKSFHDNILSFPKPVEVYFDCA